MAEPIDDQCSHGTIRGRDIQAEGTAAGIGAIEFNQWFGIIGVVAALGGAVDDYGIGDVRQSHHRRDGLHATRGDLKLNRVLARIAVGIENRLPQ